MYNKLSDKKIQFGERWIYSAGFNVDSSLNNKERLIEEINDIKRIINAGASLSILSHQGSFENNTARHLDYLIPFFNKKLQTNIKYFPENNTSKAIKLSKNLNPGQIAIFGNTRFNQGEQSNNLTLAKQFSLLGEFVAIGGFSKAHRINSSNVGITNFLPAFITQGISKQISLLDKWIGKSNIPYSVAVLGGIKKEKFTIGLSGLINKYDYIIPGGAVLNTLLNSLGINIGGSSIYSDDSDIIKLAEKIINNKNLYKKILFPKSIVIVNESLKQIKTIMFQDINKINLKDFIIVDFSITSNTESILKTASLNKGRLLMAGPPSYCKKGFINGTKQIIKYFDQNQKNSILLGGDTVSEIESKSIKSSGGGAALQYVCQQELPILEALKENKLKFDL